MGSREETVDRGLPHFTTLVDRRRHWGLMIPLEHYVRNHRESADDFICRKFREHRVTAIGEAHSSDEVSGLAENVCVRLFVRDLVLRLCSEGADANLRFFCLEIDENIVTPSMERTTFPADVVNRKAHWFAEYCAREQPNQPAYIEMLRAISHNCPEESLEVVGIDCQRIDGEEITQGYVMGADIPEDTPEDERERELQRRTRVFRQREQVTRDKFQELVRDRMQPDARALIFYGFDHLREATISPVSDFDRLDPLSFVQRLAAERRLPPSDIYTAVTAYEGLPTPTDNLRAEMNARLQDVREYDSALARVYDLLRAEFDDHSLGFDIDEAEGHRIRLHLSRQHRLGEVFDGYLFFRDLNSWDGTARLSGAEQTERAEPPPLRVTRIVPNHVYLNPEITAFVYGHFFEPVPRVIVGNDRLGFHACTSVQKINDNVLQVQFPDIRTAGEWIDVVVQRDYVPVGSESGVYAEEAEEDSTPDGLSELMDDATSGELGTTSTQRYTLRSGFRYRAMIF